ncbi:MAG TPA: hypothetical protein VLE72_02935 [Candidatus Saccharimonadales bacterium]|nr:hypothetical protein [Candidatus Saccharimonadales bacterium]
MTKLSDKIRKELSLVESPSEMPIKIIAVDGHGGSGKSTLAGQLSQELGATVAQVDDFASFDNPSDWTEKFVESVIKPIKAGAKSLSYSRSKWWPDHDPQPVEGQLVTPIMILDGVRSNRKELRPYLAYSIWVETPEDLCLARGIERDKKQGTEEDIKKIWQDWLKDENAYIQRDQPKENSDIIVDGTEGY